MKLHNSKLKDKYYINEKTHLATKKQFDKVDNGRGGSNKLRGVREKTKN